MSRCRPCRHHLGPPRASALLVAALATALCLLAAPAAAVPPMQGGPVDLLSEGSFVSLIGPRSLPGARAQSALADPGITPFFGDLAGFNTAAGNPPVGIDFDNIPAETDITGTKLAGVTFLRGEQPAPSAPLLVVDGADTFTPAGFSGATDPTTNQLLPTSGAKVLSPGGVELAPGPNALKQNDDLLLDFGNPVSAVGFDVLWQSLDCCSHLAVTVFSPSGDVLYSNPSIPTGSSGGGGEPGGRTFVGFVSTASDIAFVEVDDYDDDNVFPDANVGFDTIRKTPETELRALEINQSIQDWHNSVPEVEGKATTVRALIQTKPGIGSRSVVGRLFGTRDGEALDGSPLAATNPGSAVLARTDIESRRGTLQDSLNFQLPESWLSGAIELKFEGTGGAVVGAVGCAEFAGPGSDPPNDCKTTISFEGAPRPAITFVRVPYTDSSGNLIQPTDAELLEQMERVRSLFPVASIEYKLDAINKFSSRPEPAAVNKRLATKLLYDCALAFEPFPVEMCSLRPGQPRLYGVLDGNPPGTVAGSAAGVPGNVASGYLSGAGALAGTGYSRNRAAHELGHSYGRQHAVDDSLPFKKDRKQGRCGEDAPKSAPGFPFFADIGGETKPVLGPLGAGADNEIWGLDNRFVNTNSNNLAVSDPRQTFELMSYCSGPGPQSRWISQFTYAGLLREGLRSSVPRTSGMTAAADDFLVVRGTIDFDHDAATLDPVTELEGRPPPVPVGEYGVRLVGAGGQELRHAAFEPTAMEADVVPGGVAPPPVGLFLVPIERPSDPVAKVEILHNGAVIGSATASRNAPTVRIDKPTGGQSFAGENVTFAWTGSDGDRGRLTYTVLYSDDDGHTWKTLAVDHTQHSLTVRRRDLAASNTARLQVLVSDGVQVESAVSGRFAVANNAPLVSIETPTDADPPYSGQQNIFLQATSIDSEDGLLTGGAIRWSSDVDGALGTGQSLVVNASDLSVGRHVITATATDRSGASSSDSATIRVIRAGQPRPECSDSHDNDHDGEIDFPDDPGCTDAHDGSEIDNGHSDHGHAE